MRIGFHAPMPPARTGVADYAAAMAAALRRAGHAVLVNAPGDVELYHLGNNPLHRPMYERALARPGLVILHDAVLQHFYLGFGGAQFYEDEFVYNYGEWRRGLARQLWRDRARSGSDPAYFAHPMLKRVAESARAVIVHNTSAAAMVRAHAPGAEVVELPHLAVAPPPADYVATLDLRAQWGLPAGACVFGVFGHLRESKRVHVALAGLRRVPAAWLLVAGEFVSEDYALAMEPLLRDNARVIRTPYLAEAAFWRHAHAVNACINLRYPAAGETSGIAIRLMSASKPVISSDSSSSLQVDPGPAEEEMLAAYMTWLAGSPRAARELGEQGRLQIETAHDADHVAGRLTELLLRITEPLLVREA